MAAQVTVRSATRFWIGCAVKPGCSCIPAGCRPNSLYCGAAQKAEGMIKTENRRALHSNAINLTYSFYHGGLDFNGTFQGSVLGTNKQVYRSGLFDSGFRFSVNLKGGPAMPISQFARWKQTVVLGASLKVIAPDRPVRSHETD